MNAYKMSTAATATSEPPPPPAAEWAYSWDPDTGCLRLLRDGKAYTSLLSLPPKGGPGVSAATRARRAARFLCDIGNGLLDDDHGWSGTGDEELRSLLSTIASAVRDIAGLV